MQSIELNIESIQICEVIPVLGCRLGRAEVCERDIKKKKWKDKRDSERKAPADKDRLWELSLTKLWVELNFFIFISILFYFF